VDRSGNWCTGGYWFTLALKNNGKTATGLDLLAHLKSAPFNPVGQDAVPSGS